MKKLRLFCAIGSVLVASSMDAKVGDTFTEGDFKFKILTEELSISGNDTTVVSGTVSATNRRTGVDYSGDYVFPQTVNHNGFDYVITTIGTKLFMNYNGMTSVTIPSTVKMIEAYAFQKASDLGNVYLSEGLEFIGSAAFDWTGIEELSIPNSVIEIGQGIISNCRNIKRLEIGTGLRFVGEVRFSNNTESMIYNEIIKDGNDGSQGGCPKLEEIAVAPDNPYFCSYDGDMYSNDMATLVMVGKHTKGDVVVPESVSKMYDGIWSHTEITSLTLPDGISNLGRQMCSSCHNLTQVNIPSGCKYVPYECFFYCTSLPRIELPVGVEVIDANAFGYCESLREIKIPNSCTRIGYMAFRGCQQFTHVTLPSRLEYFDSQFLNGCKKITEITIPATFDFDLTKSKIAPSCGVDNLGGTDTGGRLKAIYIMGDSIPDAILNSKTDWMNATIYVKKSVYNSLYPEGKVTKTIRYRNFSNQVVSKEVTCENIGWMVPITMGDAENPDGVNYKTLCRDFDADFTDPEATDPECLPFYAADVNYERTWVAMQPMRYVPSRTLANVDGYKGVDAYHGVVIEGKPGRTYYYRIGEDDYSQGAEGQTLLTARQEDNMMRGANDDHWTEMAEKHPKTGEDMTNYGLKDNKFRIFTQIGWLVYNKSYLSIPTEVANAKNFSLAFEREDGTTRIVSAESFNNACDEGNIFNLQGQKVSKPNKGIYIVNGKKLLLR